MLIGGGGHDELFGAGGVDELSDGDIDGGFPGAGVDGDRLDGGSGGNFLSYRQRTEGIEVDLAAASLGRTTREGDVLVGIQHVVGGEGDDRLAGNERVNVLDGGAGRDRLEARGGNDDLRNGESTSCGSGRDLLWGHTFDAPLGRADDLGLLERDCERFFVNGYDFEPYPRRSRSTLTFPAFTCALGEDDTGPPHDRCSVAITVRDGSAARRVLAKGRLRRGRWDDETVVLRLTPRGERVLDASGTRIADVLLRGTSTERRAWSIRL